MKRYLELMSEFQRVTFEFERKYGQRPECVFASRSWLDEFVNVIDQPTVIQVRYVSDDENEKGQSRRVIMGFPVFEVKEDGVLKAA